MKNEKKWKLFLLPSLYCYNPRTLALPSPKHRSAHLMKKKLLPCLVLLLTTTPLILAQEQEGIDILSGTVRRATAVRQKPAANQPIIKQLAANGTVRVLSPEPRNGFWRVILEGGRQGHVPATDPQP